MTGDLLDTSEALTFVSERFDQNAYNDVARLARLREVRLVDSVYHAKVGTFMEAEGDKLELRQAYFGEPAHHTFSVESGILAGVYRWSAEIKSGRTKVLKNSANYFCLYSGLNELQEDYVQLYFKKVARFATYPYFRSHFASHVAASGLMLAPLPSLTERVD